MPCAARFARNSLGFPGFFLCATEADSGWHRDSLIVRHAEVRLDGVPKHLGREIAREGSHGYVVFLHRLDVAIARYGDPIFSAFQLRLQIPERLVGLRLGYCSDTAINR